MKKYSRDGTVDMLTSKVSAERHKGSIPFGNTKFKFTILSKEEVEKDRSSVYKYLL